MTTASAGRILVVEDHDSLRRNLVALLEDEDFEVAAAQTGEEALSLIAAQDFQVVIVDVRLPGMSGLELITLAAPAHPRLRFLIHTGSVDYVLNPELTALGIGERDVFFKPICDLETFFARVHGGCAGDSP